MSVRKYSFEEINQLYADIRAVVPWLLIEVSEDEIKMALRAAYIANRAALFCTYDEEVNIVPIEKFENINPYADKKQVFKDISLLLYNCVSNGGRDFMPQKDKEVLESIKSAISWHLVEQGKEVTA